MKSIVFRFLVISLIFVQSVNAQDAQALPTYPNDFVGGPEFETTDGTKGAGTASVIKLKSDFQSYIISARHLVGPEGGFKTQTAAKDVPAFVQSIKIHAFSGGVHSYAVTGLLVPCTGTNPHTRDPLDDLAIYQLQDKSSQDQAVTLSEQLPAVGETIWVVAKVRGGVANGQIMQSAKVIENGSGWLQAQFDNDKIIPAGASGAPVLNAAGQVVGIYSAHKNSDGHVIGYIIPSTMILLVIKQLNP